MAGAKAAPWLQHPQPASWKPLPGARHAPGECLAPAGPLVWEGQDFKSLRSWRGVPAMGPTGPTRTHTGSPQELQMNLNNSTRWVIQPLAPAPAMWPFSCWVSSLLRHVKSRSQPDGSSLVLLGAGARDASAKWQTLSTSTPGSHQARGLEGAGGAGPAQGGLLSLGPAPPGARDRRCPVQAVLRCTFPTCRGCSSRSRMGGLW